MDHYLKYQALVARKKVAIVGPFRPPNADLEEFDLVIRFNDHTKPHDCIDILYSNGGSIPAESTINKCKFVVSKRSASRYNLLAAYCTEKLRPLLTWENSDDSLDFWYRKLCAELPNPLVGFVALYHMMHLPVKEIHLLGQNLYAHLPDDNGHNPRAHAAALRKFMARDKRIVADGTMLMAIERWL